MSLSIILTDLSLSSMQIADSPTSEAYPLDPLSTGSSTLSISRNKFFLHKSDFQRPRTRCISVVQAHLNECFIKGKWEAHAATAVNVCWQWLNNGARIKIDKHWIRGEALELKLRVYFVVGRNGVATVVNFNMINFITCNINFWIKLKKRKHQKYFKYHQFWNIVFKLI